MLKLTQKAHLQLPLFPGERAFLRAGKAVVQVAGAAILGQLAPIEALIGKAQYGEALHLVLVVGLSAAFAWLDKYYSAQRDSILVPAAPAPISVPAPAPAPASDPAPAAA